MNQGHKYIMIIIIMIVLLIYRNALYLIYII